MYRINTRCVEHPSAEWSKCRRHRLVDVYLLLILNDSLTQLNNYNTATSRSSESRAGSFTMCVVSGKMMLSSHTHSTRHVRTLHLSRMYVHLQDLPSLAKHFKPFSGVLNHCLDACYHGNRIYVVLEYYYVLGSRHFTIYCTYIETVWTVQYINTV